MPSFTTNRPFLSGIVHEREAGVSTVAEVASAARTCRPPPLSKKLCKKFVSIRVIRVENPNEFPKIQANPT